MQTKAVATKRMKESVMLAQTKDSIRTTKVLLLSMEGYEGQPVIADKLHFSTAMEDLTERPSLGHISNQVLQITQHYNCSPHIPLWLKMIKITGFLAPEGCWYGGLSSWIYRPGYYTSSDDQSSTKLRLSAELEGQGKTSREDFDKILGSTHYVKPKVAEDAAKMLQSVAKTAVKLAGDKMCIASIGYTLAAKRMANLDRQIVMNIQGTRNS